MGELLQGGPTAHTDDPLAMGGRIDQGIEPEKSRQVRQPFGDALQKLVWHQGDAAPCQRTDAVVHRLEDKGMEIDEIAHNVDGHDLAPAVIDQRVARREPVEQQDAVGGTIALPDEVLAGREFLLPLGHGIEGGPLRRGQFAVPEQLPGQRIGHEFTRHRLPLRQSAV